jgi:hypothetical protein
MIVFSNHRLGPAAELLVSVEVAEQMLRGTAEAARPAADGRWERELVQWLAERSRLCTALDEVDVGDIAWTPDHFEGQRRFLLAAIEQAARGSQHARALTRWAAMIQAHPKDSVQVGRRWGAVQPNI